MTNVLIAFLALSRELQFLKMIGALFQALVASFIKVQVAFQEKPSSTSLPQVIDLELCIPSFNSDFLINRL